MDHAAAFANLVNLTASTWAGTALLWLACGLGVIACGFLLDGVIEREPEVVGPAAMLVTAGLCAFYLAGRLG